jgi:hypothetical protein
MGLGNMNPGCGAPELGALLYGRACEWLGPKPFRDFMRGTVFEFPPITRTLVDPVPSGFWNPINSFSYGPRPDFEGGYLYGESSVAFELEFDAKLNVLGSGGIPINWPNGIDGTYSNFSLTLATVSTVDKPDQLGYVVSVNYSVSIPSENGELEPFAGRLNGMGALDGPSTTSYYRTTQLCKVKQGKTWASPNSAENWFNPFPVERSLYGIFEAGVWGGLDSHRCTVSPRLQRGFQLAVSPSDFTGTCCPSPTDYEELAAEFDWNPILMPGQPYNWSQSGGISHVIDFDNVSDISVSGVPTNANVLIGTDEAYPDSVVIQWNGTNTPGTYDVSITGEVASGEHSGCPIEFVYEFEVTDD